MIPIGDYKKIFSRPSRLRGGDEGFELTDSDEKVLDRAWTEEADRSGVAQTEPGMSPAEILDHYERTK